LLVGGISGGLSGMGEAFTRRRFVAAGGAGIALLGLPTWAVSRGATTPTVLVFGDQRQATLAAVVDAVGRAGQFSVPPNGAAQVVDAVSSGFSAGSDGDRAWLLVALDAAANGSPSDFLSSSPEGQSEQLRDGVRDMGLFRDSELVRGSLVQHVLGIAARPFVPATSRFQYSDVRV
jgi:hypothetical protein